MQLFLLAALKAIDDADCDIITKRRVREVNEIPGALWHIYCAEEADKIRDLLNKVIDLCPFIAFFFFLNNAHLLEYLNVTITHSKLDLTFYFRWGKKMDRRSSLIMTLFMIKAGI